MTDEFLGVPLPIITQIGKVVLLAARVEDLAYRIAEGALDIRNIRRRSAKEALKTVAEHVKTVGVPPWTEGRSDAEAVRRWVSEAKSALSGRDRVVHATPYYRKGPSGWVQVFQPNNGREDERPFTVEQLEKIVSSFNSVWRQGYALWQSLMPQVASSAVVIPFGRDRGVVVHGDAAAPPIDPTEFSRRIADIRATYGLDLPPS